MSEPKILDATCGNRGIWFQKEEPHTTYCDIRKESHEIYCGHPVSGKKNHNTLEISPDIQCDFRNLPFEDGTYNLVILDPPHLKNQTESSWMRKEYGSLDGDWQSMIRDGFRECMRVLKVGGVLIFKWSEVQISTREIINVIGQEPLFGHRSGKKMNTHWMCYMKFEGSGNERT